MQINIAAFGRPAPQGSHDLGSAGQFLDSSPYLAAWRVAVKNGAYRAYKSLGIDPKTLPLFPAGTPVTIESCTFYVAPDQCRAEGTDEPLGLPDIDKLLRGTLDALGAAKKGGNARLYADDSQVWRVRDLSKVRATGRTGAFIVVSDGRD